MYSGDVLVGACIYGKLGMANAWKRYVDSEDDLLELRRLVLIDDTPKNTESWFIGKTLQWLKQHTDVSLIVSYADPNYGHSGIVYQASNFLYIGDTSPGRVIMFNGKKYHDKAVRAKYKGELKPFARRLREALVSGEAEYVHQVEKHIYVYPLHRTARRRVLRDFKVYPYPQG